MPQVVFITGASSGIGRAAALAFAAAGYHVAGTARRAERLEVLRAEVAALPRPHGEFLPLTADVSDLEAMMAAVQATVAQWGQLDVLVANAGVGLRGPLVDTDWDDLETLLRTNVDGVLHSIRLCVPHMCQRQSGHILIISSVAYNLVSPNAAAYAASKAFVSSMAASLRIELAGDNIAVSDFLLGRTATEFNQNRLGAGPRRSSSLPVMSSEQVAAALVRTVQRPRDRVLLRWIDRVIVWGNHWFPGMMGRLAKQQYR